MGVIKANFRCFFANMLVFGALPRLLAWLFASGVLYSLGALFYLWKGLRFHHAIWHVFVMGGSTCHYLAVLFYFS
jgi:hemolysin III